MAWLRWLKDKVQELFCDSVKFWHSELFANFLFHAAFPTLLCCYKVMEITCRVLAAWEYVSHSLCTADANAPASPTALFTSSSRVTNQIHLLCLSLKMHKWPLLQGINSKNKKLKTVVLILVLWQVQRRNGSRNREGTKSLDWRHDVKQYFCGSTRSHTWFVHEYLTRQIHLTSLGFYVACVSVWVWTEGRTDLGSQPLTVREN